MDKSKKNLLPPFFSHQKNVAIFLHTWWYIKENEGPKERETVSGWERKELNNFIINMKECVVFMKLAEISFKNPAHIFHKKHINHIFHLINFQGWTNAKLLYVYMYEYTRWLKH